MPQSVAVSVKGQRVMINHSVLKITKNASFEFFTHKKYYKVYVRCVGVCGVLGCMWVCGNVLDLGVYDLQ